MHFKALDDWLRWQESLHPKTIDLGLERVARVYKALNPEQLKPATIIVAGTNGKGSCIAFMEAIYTAAGYRVGSYTSPHILKYNERIKIAGEPVTDELICKAFGRIEAVRGGTSLSYFEFGTLAALDIFWRSDLDIQLLEVGLGGRLDAVNIIDADIAIVSTICIDHADWLGETRAAIGREKAGIFRAEVPAVIGDPEPPDSLLASAVEKQAIIYAFGQAFDYSTTDTGWDWHQNSQVKLSNLPEPILKGEQQYRNASTAMMAVMLMQDKLPVPTVAFSKGLLSAHLPGRFQLIKDKIPVLLDVAHNPQAVRMLVASLEQNFSNKRIHAVFAMMKDKDISGVVELMRSHVVAWYIAPLKHSRIAEESFMKAVFKKAEVANVSFGFEGFDEAFLAAQANAQQEDLILIFGSFFLVSAYLARRDEEKKL